MALLVGLGNPGASYEKTRHNLGFRIVRAWAEKHTLSFKKKEKWFSLAAEGEVSGSSVIALLPQTYMNLSGKAVAAAIRSTGIDAGKVLIVVDDADLPFGRIKMKIHSGPGGHNGLKSIEEALQTNRYVRLKVGIGAPQEESLESYVLRRFSSEEEETLPQIVERALFAIEVWLEKGLVRAMDVVNRPSNPSNGDKNG